METPILDYFRHNSNIRFNVISPNKRHSQNPMNMNLKSLNLNDNNDLDNDKNLNKDNINSVNSSAMDDMGMNFTREEVIKKCSNIFYNFSKFDKKDKKFYINITNIKKVFKKINLIDEKTLKSSDIDILTKKINPNINKFNEKNFLDLIVMIAARVYPKEYKKNPKSTVDNLISNFFEPFSNHIDDQNIGLQEAIRTPYLHRSLDLLISKFVIDYKLIALLNNVLFAVKEIYKNYFTLENITSKNYDKICDSSQNHLISFCKDFQILPFMISQDQLVIYYDLIIKSDINKLTNNLKNPNEGESYESFIIDPKKDMGTVYTLSRFCTSLIHFSIFSFKKNNELNLNNINDAEKFLLFLEKLENSKGFQNFEKKSNRPHTNKLTLIPGKSVLKMINSPLLEAYDFFGDSNNHNNFNNNLNKSVNLNLENNNNNFNSNLNNAFLIQSQRIIQNDKIIKDYNEKVKNNEDFEMKNLLNITEDCFESLINSRIDLLKDLFLRYAKLGEKLNTAKISLLSFIKFLKDCGVLPTDNFNKNNSNKLSISTSKNMKNMISSTQISKTPSKTLKKNPMSNSLSKSPIASRTAIKEKDNSNFINNNSKDLQLNLIPMNIGSGHAGTPISGNKIKNASFYGPGERKLTDSDVNVIYSTLMGPRNMDNAAKIKSQFDKNSGFSSSCNEVTRYAIIDRNTQLGNGVFNVKMDFYMFIKSFELVANKLFPELKLNNAMHKLFSEVKNLNHFYICLKSLYNNY